MAKEEPMTMDEVELVPPDDERDGACAVARMLRAVLVEAGGKARLHWLNEAGEIVDEMALDPARPAGRWSVSPGAPSWPRSWWRCCSRPLSRSGAPAA
jgi:hypothetical protein